MLDEMQVAYLYKNCCLRKIQINPVFSILPAHPGFGAMSTVRGGPLLTHFCLTLHSPWKPNECWYEEYSKLSKINGGGQEGLEPECCVCPQGNSAGYTMRIKQK